MRRMRLLTGAGRGSWSDARMKHFNINNMKLSTDRIKRVFLFSFFFGIVAHGSMLSKTILWHDGLHFAHHVKGVWNLME